MKKELLIFLFILLSVVGTMYVICSRFKNNPLDIQVHDTYFVIDFRSLFFLSSLISLYFIYLIKEGFSLFQNLFSNIILLIISIFWSIFLGSLLMSFSSAGTTVFPPLDENDYESPKIIENMKMLFFALQIINIFILVFLSIQIGRIYFTKS